MPDDVELEGIQLADVRFGSFDAFGDKLWVATSQFDGVVKLGYGTNRQEALEKLFHEAFPEMKDLQYSDQAKMRLAMRGGL